ncbi:hypothetical protein KFL_001410080 [Klebsormidium nitens]|uniref:DUF3429 domain-containing protein n=1 Tax=Klebsormidium nitens TaxID=105231 RepID=A0A0U9HJS8_KLENI|nr:hypothetical protein KFL_001410080 [Klebsormidium nitens]|eukprot:GAQ83250.1 hypothetical protein KFL_001410080 [Klebsormidium nitens]
MVAQELQVAPVLNLDEAGHAKRLSSALFQKKHGPLLLRASLHNQSWQTGTETFGSRAAASDEAAYLKLKNYQHCIGISGRPSPITYSAVRQQHSNAAPHASGASTTQGAKKVHGESTGGKQENGGGKQETNGGGTGRGFFSNLQDVPLVPLLLGFAGATPFVALAPPVAPLLPLPEDMHKRRADWQAAYGAVIASFLGGVHWGLAMAEHGHRASMASFSISTLRYTWGVIPSLLAWPALLLPPAGKFAALSGILTLSFLVDAGFAQLKLLPKWYMPLRVSLTVLAVGSLISSWSLAAVKSTYDMARNPVKVKEERSPEVKVTPESKAL